MSETNQTIEQQEKFKSRLIVIEGPDGSGKTELIRRIIKKYPERFMSLKFPTPQGKQKVLDFISEGKEPTIENLIKHHFIFIQDILDFQTELNEILFRNRNKKHVLMDRYYFSFLTYFLFELTLHYRNNMDLNEKDVPTKWRALKEQVIHKYLNQCRVPDHVILLVDNFAEKTPNETDINAYTHDQLQEIKTIYPEEIEAYKDYLEKKHKHNFKFEKIEALNSTEDRLEDYLFGNGLITKRAIVQ